MSKKKKIVFVIESLHLGGAERSIVTLLQNLDTEKYEVDLLTITPGGIFRNLVPNDVHQVHLQLKKVGIWNRVKYYLAKKRIKDKHSAQLFWNIIKSTIDLYPKEYDIAVAYGQGFVSYYVHDFIQAKKKFAWLNTDYLKAKYDIHFDFPFYKDYDALVAVSPEAKQSLHKALGSIGEQLDITVIKDITDQAFIAKLAEVPIKTKFDAEAINILTVGRLAKEKGIHLAIGACKILRQRGHNVHWYELGEGAERADLTKLIEANHLEKYFTLLGADPNPYPYIKACNIYCQTSLFEGLGLTLIEASLLLKPIVTTNFPTAYGILENGKNGSIVAMDASAIADEIEQLIQNPSIAEAYVRRLSQLENTDKNLALQQIEDLFD